MQYIYALYTYIFFQFDDCHDSENDEELDTSIAQAPVRMYKIEVLDSWKSARGQVYL